jgi:cystathionine beta-lyase/cystathionine gamma-synthase
MKVPPIDLQAQYQTIRDEVRLAVERVFESQQFVMGAEVQALEEEIAEYSQAKFAIGCASGSDALLLALMSCGVGRDDEVITTPSRLHGSPRGRYSWILTSALSISIRRWSAKRSRRGQRRLCPCIFTDNAPRWIR